MCGYFGFFHIFFRCVQKAAEKKLPPFRMVTPLKSPNQTAEYENRFILIEFMGNKRIFSRAIELIANRTERERERDKRVKEREQEQIKRTQTWSGLVITFKFFSPKTTIKRDE